jgi:hypothetical protein
LEEKMAAIVRVHHPVLTPSERAAREEEIKRALVQFYKDVYGNEQRKKHLTNDDFEKDNNL